MNMKWKLSTLALAAAVSFGASAADVTLSVKGEITPGSCTPTLSATDVDYGTINASTLTAVAPALNQLGNKTINLGINCTAAVPVGITAIDARSDSSVALDATSYIENAGAASIRLTAPGNAYGLGKQNNVNIGSYALAVDVAQVSATDGTDTSFTPDVIRANITSMTPFTVDSWVKTLNGFIISNVTGASTGSVVTLSRPGASVPVAIKTATVPLIISSAVQDISLFGAAGGDSIKLDGNTTISLVYL